MALNYSPTLLFMLPEFSRKESDVNCNGVGIPDILLKAELSNDERKYQNKGSESSRLSLFQLLQGKRCH